MKKGKITLVFLVVLYGVLAPDHSFVRYDDGKRRINIETTKSGQGYEDSYIQHIKVLE